MSTDPLKTATKALDPAHWLQEYGDALYRYALRRLQNPVHAEDVVQETLLAAFKSHQSFSGRASEKTWLTGILKHKIVDFIRKQVRESTVDDISALSDNAAASAVDEMFDARGSWIIPPQDWGNPDKALHHQQFLAAFKACLEQLNTAHAQVFSLKELGGNSVEDICNELGITATNCGVMLYRARMGLRQCLETRWTGGESGDIY